MTLKNDILSLLEKRGRSQFKDIRDQTNPPGKKKNEGWDVQVSNCLKGLRNEELVIRKYDDRDSFYKITDKGKSELQRERALGEVSQTSFANLHCQVVPSADGKAWASVYGSPLDPFTGKRLVDAMKNAKVTTIIMHEGKPPKEG